MLSQKETVMSFLSGSDIRSILSSFFISIKTKTTIYQCLHADTKKKKTTKKSKKHKQNTKRNQKKQE
ncbi:hypothetical protein SBK12_004631 [Escherichia coli]|uniref:hypothetical protein n=1 Tax=Escherichia coli TaxID=562 RepID=UPI0014858EAC|nr:hypothetical protein [Escherichia coli]EED0018180.1 hypothetical protein [Escherichia coli]EED1250314.1 hypothetical protein [Escherichia coli]EED1732689.1 hypothetical protein [Escherichia coli]EEQ9398525.1 hypothetical protein [Escherichia coli]EES0457420.1 hypothetical protein [Escherichia coli]